MCVKVFPNCRERAAAEGASPARGKTGGKQVVPCFELLWQPPSLEAATAFYSYLAVNSLTSTTSSRTNSQKVAWIDLSFRGSAAKRPFVGPVEVEKFSSQLHASDLSAVLGVGQRGLMVAFIER